MEVDGEPVAVVAAPTASLQPAPTPFIRVRRKRNAEPAEQLLLSIKRARPSDEDDKLPQCVLLARVAATPGAARVLDVEEDERKTEEKKKQDKENEEAGTDELSFVSSDAIGEIGDEKGMGDPRKSKKDTTEILLNGQKLQRLEEVEKKAAKEGEDDEIFDLYRIVHPGDVVHFESIEDEDCRLAIESEAQLLAYIKAMDGESNCESDVDDEDSNDENYYMNDYPDEDEDSAGGDSDCDEYGIRRRSTAATRRSYLYGEDEHDDSEEDGGGGEDDEIDMSNFHLG